MHGFTVHVGRRVVLCAAWAIACILILADSSARAAPASTTIGPPAVVTSTRLSDTAAELPIGTRIITARDIERSGALTLPDLLRALPDIRARDLQGSPNPHIDMRGFGSTFGDQNTLVLVDGARAREYEQLSVNWSSIPLGAIERIEILPPGGSVLYGGGAAGGVINIITRAPKASSGHAGATVGSLDTAGAQAGASVAGENAGLRLYGNHYESKNYRDNNRVRIDNAQIDIRWTGQAGSLGLKLGADDQYNGLPNVISEAQIAINRRAALTPQDFATQHGGYLNLAARTTVGSGDALVTLGYRNRDTSSAFLVGTPLRNNVDTIFRWRQEGKDCSHTSGL